MSQFYLCFRFEETYGLALAESSFCLAIVSCKVIVYAALSDDGIKSVFGCINCKLLKARFRHMSWF